MKPIETSYNGYRFRSRLEARTAVFLDAAKIPYLYEPEGVVFEDGTTYLPDFYLPQQDTFLECKGIMNNKDEHKIGLLAKATGKEIIIVGPSMEIFTGEWADNMHERCPLDPDGPGLDVQDAFIGRCDNCHKLFIAPINYGWECRCCGYYDVDSGFEWLYDYENTNYEPIIKAKQARFEFGEAGA